MRIINQPCGRKVKCEWVEANVDPALQVVERDQELLEEGHTDHSGSLALLEDDPRMALLLVQAVRRGDSFRWKRIYDTIDLDFKSLHMGPDLFARRPCLAIPKELWALANFGARDSWDFLHLEGPLSVNSSLALRQDEQVVLSRGEYCTLGDVILESYAIIGHLVDVQKHLHCVDAFGERGLKFVTVPDVVCCHIVFQRPKSHY